MKCAPSSHEWSPRFSDWSLLWRTVDPRLWWPRSSRPLAILLYAQPFSGSTAVAACLAQLPGIAGIGPSFEMQWRFARLSDEKRWLPGRRYSHARGIRSVLESTAFGPGFRGVVEKSPPNCLRIAAVRQWFAGFECHELVLSRHPLAQWSSACQRHWRDGRCYPSWMASWEACLARVPAELAVAIKQHAVTFELRLLGLWLMRSQLLLHQFGHHAMTHWRYEDFTRRPNQFISSLGHDLGLRADGLSGLTTVRIKGGDAQIITNRNQEQLDEMPAHLLEAGLQFLREPSVMLLLQQWGYQPDPDPSS